ncbi:FAD-binding and (Fe-S)-binding domain-containing protein [Salinisphaera sp. SPP-AMP-43]|uniref:FAD-binding and (Fe-S)-binding domain-containing protein n=1 Tax=Salinisphaera sp. SPP-AMP-43 TaxID=3121288 RepID=UPI003C6DEFBE
MLPTLPPEHALDPLQRAFVERVAALGFAGDIDTSYATRITLATDNSAFQTLPAGVFFPRDEADIERVAAALAEPEFHAIYLAPRGGGTSTIGCSLTAGFVLDCSRHMNRIVSIDPAAREVVVQPGVVLDQLNDALAEHDLFFAPNVAPSSRATLGGMANTDGCGKGSRIHGKTSDHVLATRVVLTDGAVHVIDSRAHAPAPDARIAAINDRVKTIIDDNRGEIERVFPDLSRYLSGYNLAQAVDDNGRCHLNKLIGGSEGTLALVSQLTLKLTPIPDTTVLYALRYDSFDAALRDAETLVEYDPSAIESVDEKVMSLARDNPIYERVRDMIENADGSTPGAVNLVEFAGRGSLPEGAARLDTALGNGEGGAIGYYRAEAAERRAALWALRKGGVGLLGSTPGAKKPLPFVEDTVVDPRFLADYVADFRAILDEYGVAYGMFGHIDVGCLHVRPALDLTDPADERIMREITTRVRHLAESYGGLLWNEHGKGYRSEYNRPFFGEPLYGALGEIKRAFDPRNQLNPGKIVALDPERVPIAAMDAPTRGTFDRQIPADERAAFPGAMQCNGNGACFDYDPAHVMCPSYRATRDRLHSPKGRASAMREWLRQLAEAGHTTADLAPAESSLWLRAARDLAADPADPETDFSHQVWQAMDGCLSCRACATQCPIRVDVPAFKSEFLAMYHGRYARPPADYALAGLETGARLAARLPGLANALIRRPAIQRLLANRLGLVDPPEFSRPTLTAWLRERPAYRYSPDRWTLMPDAERERAVFIIQDAFTSFFDAPAVTSVIELIAALGYRPQVAPFMPSGKPLHVKGFTPEFERTAARMAQGIDQLAAHGRPLIGIEPSVVRSLASDYRHVLGRALPVVALERWLAQAVPAAKPAAPDNSPRFRLFNHCTAQTDSAASDRDWHTVFETLGLSLDSGQVGCCGMSGAYGHEARHRATSAAIFDLSWSGALAADTAQPVVPGYSCRSQIARLDGARTPHPAQLLLDHLAPNHTSGRSLAEN